MGRDEAPQGATDLRRLVAQLETIAQRDPHKSVACAELLQKLRPYLEEAA